MKLFKRVLAVGSLIVLLSLSRAGMAAAHVVVTPAEVKTASRQTFAVSVPNEHETPVTGVRLVIPEGLESVRPYTKAGWTVHVEKTGEGEDVTATEIIWTGGSIPVDLKDDFLFSAKVPAEATDLKWKAYETYADGLVVAWEQEPSEAEGNKPYSVTKVVNQNAQEAALSKTQATLADTEKAADRAMILAIAGIVIGILGFATAMRSKKG